MENIKLERMRQGELMKLAKHLKCSPEEVLETVIEFYHSTDCGELAPGWKTYNVSDWGLVSVNVSENKIF